MHPYWVYHGWDIHNSVTGFLLLVQTQMIYFYSVQHINTVSRSKQELCHQEPCKTSNIWVRSWNCGCLVTWLCYQLIVKPGKKQQQFRDLTHIMTAKMYWTTEHIIPLGGQVLAYVDWVLISQGNHCHTSHISIYDMTLTIACWASVLSKMWQVSPFCLCKSLCWTTDQTDHAVLPLC